MKTGLLLLVFLFCTATIKGQDDEAVVFEEEVTTALSEGNVGVVNQAMNSGSSDVVASAFSTAYKTGNTGILSQFIYQVMSSNPPESSMSNQMLDIMTMIIKNNNDDGCIQIQQIMKEIDSLIANDEVSEKLQTAFQGDKGVSVRNCMDSLPKAFVPDQNLCVEASTRCSFLYKSNKHLTNYASQCHVKRTCNFNGYGSNNQCRQNCER